MSRPRDALAARQGVRQLRNPKPVDHATRADEIMANDHLGGQRDGLRLALAILEAEEVKWAALLGESRSGRTNAIREVRHKTLQVAQSRIRTALNRLSRDKRSASNDELTVALEKAGL